LKRLHKLQEREERLLKRAKLKEHTMPRNTENTSLVSMFKVIWINLRKKIKIDSRNNSANGTPTSPRLKLQLLRLFTKRLMEILERIPRELRLRESKPLLESKSPKLTVLLFNKTPRVRNGSDNSNSLRIKENKELLPRSKKLFKRND